MRGGGRERLARPSRPRRRCSRRRAASRGARAGSAARRRRRGRAGRSCPQLRRHLDDRQRERERRALPGPRLGPDAAAVRLGEAARDREAEARAGARVAARGGRTARRRARARPRARPGPWSTTRTIASLRVAVIRTTTCASGGENLSAFSIRFASTRWTCARVDVDERRLADDVDAVARAERRRPPRATRSSSDQSSRSGAAPPASSRERSSRSPTSRPSRSDVELDRLEQLVAVGVAQAGASGCAARRSPCGCR